MRGWREKHKRRRAEKNSGKWEKMPRAGGRGGNAREEEPGGEEGESRRKGGVGTEKWEGWGREVEGGRE